MVLAGFSEKVSRKCREFFAKNLKNYGTKPPHWLIDCGDLVHIVVIYR